MHPFSSSRFSCHAHVYRYQIHRGTISPSLPLVVRARDGPWCIYISMYTTDLRDDERERKERCASSWTNTHDEWTTIGKTPSSLLTRIASAFDNLPNPLHTFLPYLPCLPELPFHRPASIPRPLSLITSKDPTHPTSPSCRPSRSSLGLSSRLFQPSNLPF